MSGFGLLLLLAQLADALRARVTNDVAAGQPILVHVVVALCDNEHQGIVPVPAGVGNGQQPRTNLYWGAAHGVRTFLTRSAGWRLESATTAPVPNVLERIVLTKSVAREKGRVAVRLVAEAWDGRAMKEAIERFLSLAAGHAVDAADGERPHVIAFVGHDALMDFSLPSAPRASKDAPPRGSIVLACASRSYFAAHLGAGGSRPLVLTSGLMAPEAYTLDAALTAFAAGADEGAVREAAAVAYDRHQKCGLRAARRLFVGP